MSWDVEANKNMPEREIINTEAVVHCPSKCKMELTGTKAEVDMRKAGKVALKIMMRNLNVERYKGKMSVERFKLYMAKQLEEKKTNFIDQIYVLG